MQHVQTMSVKKVLFIILLVFTGANVNAQVWQWSYPLKHSREHQGEATAFLWIPEDCRQIKAIIVAQNNMEEQSILENPIFRKGLKEMGIAEIWVSPMFDHSFLFNKGAGETFNEFMDALAGISGYTELKFVPVIGMGHSAAASWPYYLAAWGPQRALACLSVSGQWPYVRNEGFAPDIWSKEQNIDFIPLLETMGEYESAENWATEGLHERQQHPLMPLSMLASPAQGHFASTDKKVKYLLLYIKKAMQYRLPAQVSLNSYTKLNPVDPTKSGWLIDRWRLNQPTRAKSAPVKEYQGNPAEAFWFFDEEIVRATEAYEAEYRNLQPQLIGYVQQGKVLPQRNSHLQVELRFMPLADGVTFQVGATFMDTVGGGSPRLAQWTHLPVGSPIGHPSDTSGISVDKVSGPFVKLSRNTFRLNLEKGLATAPNYNLTFAATDPGDSKYKPAVQQANMNVPENLTEGRDQIITFPKINDQKVGKRSIALHANSDSGLPVYFYVKEGPAEIVGNTLNFTGIPPRSRFPVKVTVVAWQYGRMLAPQVKTAKPVTQSFYITR